MRIPKQGVTRSGGTLPTAIESLDTLDDLPDPAKVLRADPELSAAADQASTCQRIGGL